MQAIATLLDQSSDQATIKMWDDLKQDFFLSGINLTPTPHFTWFGGDEFDAVETKSTIESLADELLPFEVSTTGLGFFTTPKPVIYLPIIKSRKLLEAHEVVWKALTRYGRNVSEIYKPDLWIPHITLAHSDLSRATLAGILDNLMNNELKFTIKVNNLALIFATADSSGIIFHKKFCREEK